MSQDAEIGMTAAAQAALDTARALAKLLSFASMYPADHPLVEEAADHAVQRVQLVGSDISLHVQSEALWVQGQPVAIENREIGRLHENLRAIGILSAQIDCHATREDLSRFAVAILDAKKEIARAAGFVELDLTGSFPTAVHVQRRGFGARISDRGILDTQATTEDMMAALAGVDAAEEPTVSRAVRELVPRILEQFELEAGEDDAHDTNRALDEVLELCAAALRAGVQDLLERGGVLGDLSSLFEATENALSAANDADSAELMMDVLHRAAEDLNADSPSMPNERSIDDGYELSIEHLRIRIEEFTQGASPLEATDQITEDAETLSILLQLCARRPPRAVIDRILSILRPGGGAQWAEREVRILEGGILDILSTHDMLLVDATVPSLLFLLRMDSPNQLTRLLARVATGAELAHVESYFWPHLVNEILVGAHAQEQDRIDSHHLSELSRIACDFDARTADGRFRRLVKLDALHKRRICEDALAMRRHEAMPILASLFQSPLGKRIADLVFRAVRQRPPDWIGSHAIVHASSLTRRVRDLLFELLRTGGKFETSRAAAEIAAAILVRLISALPELRREEPWVAESLRSIGLLDDIVSESLLQRVVREKSFLSYEWPKECRQVAKRALSLQRAHGGGS